MKIACDVDGVVVALHLEWFRRYNRDYDDDLTIDRVLSWNTHEWVKPECGKKIYEYLMQPDLYEAIEPLPGAVEGIRALREAGHEFAFVTSNAYGMTDQKAQLLERLGVVKPAHGRQLPEELIVASGPRKLWISADLLIDDRGETVETWVQQTMRPAILVEYPHNASYELTKHNPDWVYGVSASPDMAAAWPAIVNYVTSNDARQWDLRMEHL